jgi:hypothetical protein
VWRGPRHTRCPRSKSFFASFCSQKEVLPSPILAFSYLR